MRVFRNFFLTLVSVVLISCSGISEEQLIGDWDRRTDYPINGICFAATFVIGDVGYVVGGFNGTNPPRREVYAFHHLGGGPVQGDESRTRGVWDETLSPLPSEIGARQQAVGFSLKRSDGKEFGFMGSGWIFDPETNDYHTSNDFWRYDPETDTWEQVADLPSYGRRGAFAFTLTVGNKEYGYVGGGYTDRNVGDTYTDKDGVEITIQHPPSMTYLSQLWRYDPDEDTWEQVSSTFGRRLGGAAFVIDNKAYICNGENPGLINDFWEFDPNNADNEWWKQLRPMNSVNINESYDDEYGRLGRSHGVAFVVYVPERDGVAKLDGSLHDGPTGHIVGGSLNAGSSCWEYDEIDDLWTQRTSLINHQRAQNREGMISFSFPRTGRAFVGLGRSGSNFWWDMWEFIPRVEDEVNRDWQ